MTIPDELIPDSVTAAAAKAMKEAFAAESATPAETPELRVPTKTTAKDAAQKAGEDPDEILDLEDVDISDDIAPEDEWDALKKLGLKPQQITALLADKAAGRSPTPDSRPQEATGLSREQTNTLRMLMKSNPEAAPAYMDAISRGMSADDDYVDPDTPKEEILSRRLQKQEQQMAALQWQLVERDLGSRVHAALSKFEILNDPEKITDVTKSVIAEVCQDKAVDASNVGAAIQAILERKNKEEHRTIRRYLEGKKAAQKLHPPSPKGASVGSPAKKPVSKPRNTLSDWNDIEEQVASALRRDMGHS